MGKSIHSVRMSGHLIDGTVAKTHQASDVRSFMDAEGRFIATSAVDGSVTLKTSKGSYRLIKHETIGGLYFGTCKGVKTHFNKKQVVASLKYWAV